jgi:hypothetical protein
MDNIEFMQVFHPRDNLMEELAGLGFLDPLVGHDIVEEFSPAGVLHDKVELFGGFDDLGVNN